MNREDIWFYTKQALTISIIIALGLFAFNQFIEWKYKAQILAGPCGTCVALNPEWQQCYDYISKPQPSYGSQINFSLPIS